MEKQKKNKLFEFFNFNRGERPDAVEEDTTPTVKRYFKLLGRRFWKLFMLNVMMLFTVIPLLLIVFLLINIPRTPTLTYAVFPQIYGANLMDHSPISTLLLDLFGAQTGVPVYNATVSYVLIGVCAVFLLVTFGWQNIGATYILRSMVRGEPIFLWSDYFYAIKKNLKQGFFLGVLDLAVIFLLIYDFLYFSGMTGSFWLDVGFYGICAIGILYFFLRFYIYLLQITFHLSIRKILKNALIFSVLGFKRNFMALLGILLWTALIVVLLPLLSYGIALAIILPLLYYLAFTAFTSAYAAYPIIDRYMIEPYRNASNDEDEFDGETDAEGSEEPPAQEDL